MRISEKKVKELTGKVIRLIPTNDQDWFPHGILKERGPMSWTIHTYRGGYLGSMTIPRADYKDVEELDVHPELYGKRGLPSHIK